MYLSELCVRILSKVVAAVKKNTQMSFMSSLRKEQDSLPQIKLRLKYLEEVPDFLLIVLRTSFLWSFLSKLPFLSQPFLTCPFFLSPS